jgi:hypothetical protein
MPHQTVWLVEKRVILVTFSGVITAEELAEFVQETEHLIASGIPLVHLITDSLAMERVAFSLGTLRSLALAYQLTGKLGWQIDVNHNPLLKMLVAIGTQFARVRTRTFKTLADAIQFLKTNDVTLSNAEWRHDLPTTH